MVKYIYDAWGNFAIEQSSNCNQSAMQLGYLNPYRYREYYYDSENNLYYLQTRYYDPEIGRFISQDSIEYADPETINGLNLYAYCGNNPVMNIDPTGTFFWALLIGAIIGGVIGGTVKAVSAAISGGNALSCLGAFVGGFITGGVLGAASVLGGGFAVGALTATTASIAGTAAFLTVGTFVAGMASYGAENWISGNKMTLNSALKNGALTFAQGLFSFGIGAALGASGFYNSLKPGNGFMDTIRSSKQFFIMETGKAGFKNFVYGTSIYFSNNLGAMIARGFVKSIFVSPWNLIKT